MNQLRIFLTTYSHNAGTDGNLGNPLLSLQTTAPVPTPATKNAQPVVIRQQANNIGIKKFCPINLLLMILQKSARNNLNKTYDDVVKSYAMPLCGAVTENNYA